MIPLGDASRRLRSIPVATLLIIGANAVVFWLELSNGTAFIQHWTMVPAQVAAGHRLITIFTAMFMHAGWLHILGNMLFFWVFGPQIEDVMGPVSYLVFYLLGGLVAALAQVWIDPTSTVQTLGASGAIAAVMGAFLVTYPRDRIRTILFIGIFIDIVLMPAVILIGLWFLIQVVSQFGAIVETQSGGVAYMAHIGGFVFGMIFGRFFEIGRQRAPQRLT